MSARCETLREAYALARKNNGAPGVDGVTFEAIEAQGVEKFLEQLPGELPSDTCVPLRARRREITEGRRKSSRSVDSRLSRDRSLVQGALKLLLEPIFEADFQPGRTAIDPNAPCT